MASARGAGAARLSVLLRRSASRLPRARATAVEVAAAPAPELADVAFGVRLAASPSPPVSAELRAAAAAATPFTVACVGPAADARAALDSVRLEELLPSASDAALDSLRGHAASLAALWGRQAGEDEVAITITLTDRPTCPKMHCDHVRARLLTTFFGRGTQWADGPLARAVARVAGDSIVPYVVRDALKEACAWSPSEAAEGDVVLLLGTAWPGGGAVHRSPPVSPGEWRMFLKIDAPRDNSQLEERVQAGLRGATTTCTDDGCPCGE